MKCRNYSGSVWRKWDLHIHSNASDGKETPQEIIDKAVEEGLSVIAITDHHTVKNLDEIKKLGEKNNIVVISGIEFRTEYGAKSVHMIGLFPDKYDEMNLDQKALEELILNKLNLSETYIKQKGFEKEPGISENKAFKKGMFEVQVNFKEAADLIHEYGGIVSVHAGNKASSIEEMKHDGNSPKNVKDIVDSLGTVKEELMKEYIDICELGGKGDKNAEFYLFCYKKPSIVSSDAHEVKDIGKLYTWIKADSTFEGLKQIIYEPSERVKIQETVPESKSDYQIIESLEVEHQDFGKQTIPINQNLNSIIGGRSSGKSILLGCIAKLSNYNGEIKANNPEYNNYIDAISACMKLVWRDREETGNRKVEYFPQSYINSLASHSNEIIKLIEEILKGDEIKKQRFEKYNDELRQNKIDITKNIEELFKLSYKMYETKREMESIGDKKGIEKEILKIQAEVDDIKNTSLVKISAENEQKYKKLKDQKLEMELKIKELDTVKEQLNSLISIPISNDIDSEVIGLPELIKTSLLKQYNVLVDKFIQKWKNIVTNKKKEAENNIIFLKNEIKEILNDKEFLMSEEYYKKNKSYTELNKRLDDEKQKSSTVEKITEKSNELKLEFCKSKDMLIKKQKNYFTISESICSDISMKKDDIEILPKLKFEQEKFISNIESNMNKRGAAVNSILEYSFENIDSFGNLLEKIFNGLINNKYTLKSKTDVKQAIVDIFSNNYFKIWYDVEYQGDTLDSMSEGKKAFVILRMLLDFNENVCPILIDQPEDDLDNRAIYLDLVSYIRKKKKERQIIIVTHNPNIAVGADSEEIIVANQHGIKNENQNALKFEYITGALENSKKRDETDEATPILIGQGIREHVCDLLEGGDIAFKKRENKYGLK